MPLLHAVFSLLSGSFIYFIFHNLFSKSIRFSSFEVHVVKVNKTLKTHDAMVFLYSCFTSLRDSLLL